MTNRSILISSTYKGVRSLHSNITQFSHDIIERTPNHKISKLSINLLFQKKAKESNIVNISNYTNENTNKITVNNELHNSLLNMATQITNKTLFFKDNVLNPTFTTHTILKKERLKNRKFENKITNELENAKHKTSLHKYVNIDSKQIFNSLQSKSYTSNFDKENYFISKEKIVSKTVKNFIYKSENKVDLRIEKIENKIENLHQKTLLTEIENTSISKTKQFSEKNDLNALSQKVYTLIMKQFKYEQRRKGNLYA